MAKKKKTKKAMVEAAAKRRKKAQRKVTPKGKSTKVKRKRAMAKKKAARAVSEELPVQTPAAEETAQMELPLSEQHESMEAEPAHDDVIDAGGALPSESDVIA